MSNNTATDTFLDGSPSAEVFPTNSQASTLLVLSALKIRPWNVESLESTNNSPLALEQGVARATVQINRGRREREQRELGRKNNFKRTRTENRKRLKNKATEEEIF